MIPIHGFRFFFLRLDLLHLVLNLDSSKRHLIIRLHSTHFAHLAAAQPGMTPAPIFTMVIFEFLFI